MAYPKEKTYDITTPKGLLSVIWHLFWRKGLKKKELQIASIKLTIKWL